MEELMHYGMPRRSGRYPYGSGDRPYQGVNKKDTKRVTKALKGLNRSEERFERDHTIPKGTVMYRATGSKKETLTGTKYVTYLQPDRDLYRGGELKQRNYSKRADKVYEHTMELKEELKIPGTKIYKDSIKEVMDKNPELLVESIDTYIRKIQFGNNQYMKDMYLERTGLSEDKAVKQLVDSTIEKVSKYSLDSAMTPIMMSMGGSPNFKKALVDNLSSKGYNAMVDEAGTGVIVPEGIEPLVIFDSKKSLKMIGSAEVTAEEEKQAGENYAKWEQRAYMSGQRWRRG